MHQYTGSNYSDQIFTWGLKMRRSLLYFLLMAASVLSSSALYAKDERFKNTQIKLEGKDGFISTAVSFSDSSLLAISKEPADSINLSIPYGNIQKFYYSNPKKNVYDFFINILGSGQVEQTLVLRIPEKYESEKLRKVIPQKTGKGVFVLKPQAGIDDFAEKMVGKRVWLKVDVARVQYWLGGIDATNVYGDGSVQYRATLAVRQTQSTNARDFAQEIRGLSIAQGSNVKVRLVEKGSQVTIQKIDISPEKVYVHFSDVSGSELGMHLQFGKIYYTPEEVQNLLELAVATSKEAASKVSILNLGMSMEEVINVRGNPITQVNLGNKYIFAYEEIKLIFQENKLVDAY